MRRLCVLLLAFACWSTDAYAQSARDTAHVAAQAKRLDSLKVAIDSLARWCAGNKSPKYLVKACSYASPALLARVKAAETALLSGAPPPPPVTPPAPVARFTASCTANLTCTFDASSSTGTRLTYGWDLNQCCAPEFPPAGTGVRITNVYPHEGPRIVTLTVTDSLGRGNVLPQTVTVVATAAPVDSIAVSFDYTTRTHWPVGVGAFRSGTDTVTVCATVERSDGTTQVGVPAIFAQYVRNDSVAFAVRPEAGTALIDVCGPLVGTAVLFLREPRAVFWRSVQIGPAWMPVPYAVVP